MTQTMTALAPATASTTGVGAEATRLDTLSPARLRRAKFSYATRFAADLVDLPDTAEELFLFSGPAVRPEAGDLVLARIVELGKQLKLESPTSRRASLFVGDEVVLAYGHRYAADQFHAIVPDTLDECDLVAAGGVAGQVIEQHANIDPATRIQPIGLLSGRHGRLTTQTLARHRLDLADTSTTGRPTVVAVLGTSMNSGKTTAAAHLVRGLAQAGHRVGAGKVTGTGAGNDPGFFRDAGAAEVRDFSDFGFATTFKLDLDHITALLAAHVREFTAQGCDVIVVEIADGLFQGETRQLLEGPTFRAAVDRVVFAAGDSLGAIAGVDILGRLGLDIAAVSGLVTASPLLETEARSATDVPVVNTLELAQPDVAVALTRPAGSR